MDPILRISYGPSPTTYGPSSYARDLESRAAEAQYLLDQHPESLAHVWPFSTMGYRGAVENAGAMLDDAFSNPVPKQVGEPAMYGPYQIGYLPAHFSAESYGGGSDEHWAAMTRKARDEGLLSDAAADSLEDNPMGSEDDDFMELVQAGELSLGDAIRMLGRVPRQLKGIIEE